ncbi:DUF4905 domain-containing protein [Pontibacter liquoris]|uniref:DUF4905 domain-containing protein n=1 Tax=Pontibacter liquoris TaxID=2905677 RepID=UPI001FA6F866
MWRIRIDAEAGRLALEVRDADVLLAYFYTFDCATHTLQQLTLPQALTWWQGLEDAAHGMVYLHGYADRQLGQHKGILALNSAQNKVVWETPDMVFYGLSESGIIAHPVVNEQQVYVLLATATGKTVGEHITPEAAAQATDTYSHSRYEECRYPMVYLEGEEYFTQVQAFIVALQGHRPVKALEYAETDSLLVVSYYVETPDGKLDNYLVVFNFEADLQLNTFLGQGLSGIGTDTFFIFRHKLYFIQNKDSLQVYRLLL